MSACEQRPLFLQCKIAIMAMPIVNPEAISDPIAILKEEIQSIRFADYIYWKSEDSHSAVAMAEYERRRRRMEQIQSDLGRLLSN